MRTHLPQLLTLAEFHRLPEPHRTAVSEWMAAHGYSLGEFYTIDSQGPVPFLRIDATALLHWLDERLVDCNPGVTRFADWWEAHWLSDDGGMMSYAAPTPVAALWAAALHVLGVEAP